MQIDPLLAALARRLPNVRGAWRLRETLRQYYAQRYAQSGNEWTVIDDFDTDLKMRVNRATHLGSAVYWFGSSSIDEVHVLDDYLQPDMIFADVGANQGEITLAAAKRVPQGKVLAFEPHPVMFDLLRQNLELNQMSNVQMFNLALGEAEGRLNLYSNLSSQTAAAASNEGLSSFFSGQRETLIGEVEVKTLDQMMQDVERLDFLKIDVEGAEILVLRGAHATLQQHKPMLMIEVNAQTLERAGYQPRDLLSFIANWNYRIFLIEETGLVPLRDLSTPTYCNILCYV